MCALAFFELENFPRTQLTLNAFQAKHQLEASFIFVCLLRWIKGRDETMLVNSRAYTKQREEEGDGKWEREKEEEQALLTESESSSSTCRKKNKTLGIVVPEHDQFREELIYNIHRTSSYIQREEVGYKPWVEWPLDDIRLLAPFGFFATRRTLSVGTECTFSSSLSPLNTIALFS